MNEVSGYFSQYNDPTWNLIYSVSWFPFERPDRPSRLKKYSDDRDDHMETLPRRSQTTRTTSIAWIESSSIGTIM